MVKHIIAGLSALVFGQLFGFVSYYLIFHSWFVEFVGVYRSMDSWQWFLMPVFGFIDGIVLSFLYFWVKKNLQTTQKICPFKFAIIYTLFTRVIGELFNYTVFPYGFVVAVAGIFAGLCSSLAVACVIYLIEKRCQKKKN